MLCSLCLEITSSLHDFCQLWPRGGFSRGCVSTDSHRAKFLSETCCCLLPVNTVFGQSPHLIWFPFQGWAPWPGLNSTTCKKCGDFRPTMNGMGNEKRCLHLNKWEKQQKENSLDVGKLRQTGCPGSSHLCHHWDQNFNKLWRPVALAREREEGDNILNEKDAAHGVSLPSLSPLGLYPSILVFGGATLAAHAWMVMGHSHLLTAQAGLTAQSSCTPGMRMAPKEVVVEWQSIGRGRGFAACEDALEGVKGLWICNGKQNYFFRIIWGLTSGPHSRPWSVWGSPCIMTTNPEWQIARLLSSSFFVVRHCHYLLLIPQTER